MLTAAAVVVCALELLGRSTSPYPIKLLDQAPPGRSAHVEGFVTRNPDTIYLITSAPAFRAAQRGRFAHGSYDGCRHVASVIVHEEWHLRHGAGEEDAYLAQLMTLVTLRADGSAISSVRRSMRSAVAKEKAGRGQSGAVNGP